jgi:hypothetical protein
MLENLCIPALIYLIFAASQVSISVYKGFYSAASIQILIAIVVTFMLNTICSCRIRTKLLGSLSKTETDLTLFFETLKFDIQRLLMYR